MMFQVMTIERHILEQQAANPGATGVFTNLMYDIALAAKLIARETTRAGLGDILGLAGGENVYGEAQQKLDVFANETIIRMTEHTGRLCIMASEENEGPIPIPEQHPAGRYVLLFDPLDGSSNIDYNVSVGTIFSIYRKISPDKRGTLQDLLQPGSEQVAAGYVVYGSSTMLVYTTGNGVHGFTLDPSVGEFLLSHPDIRMPPTQEYYSVNQGYEKHWTEGVQRYVRWITGQDSERPRKGLSLRYIGSLVADFHRNLMTGGVFMYPADLKDSKKPYGKLRLCFECAPLAFIAEQAGGCASDGVNRILDIQPHSLQQRSPLFIGNRDLVDEAKQYIARYDVDWVRDYQAHLAAVAR